ncbi:CRISPR type III-A/MTUBE-associated RAMP protein Csm4 [Phocoenobacter uteri]|uniref:CRISPR system Cms protein Csm4 n=1 Tax=Phocoenobacter uteri TaxID=146806 RepID=A0A379C899_9PAST|nr:CRISPR-associated protein Csm4 [Phocoenobacter uteri]MDG6882236.1 CRISPR-associated protein Csm4 [Phocoenobacter uteri]SUB58389.1 CRISPR type III-A/MTUBE-associated RAMP protein Csm4 [Phocoenobacter uteri]
MKTYRITIETLTAFGTPLVGDTLFGQVCWGIRHQFGNVRLETLLQGYTENQPFLVVSHAMPSGYIPLPTIPSNLWQEGDEKDRKKLKKKKWLDIKSIEEPTTLWQQKAVAESEIDTFKVESSTQPHNSINRATSTTDDQRFAPYSQSQIWYGKETKLDLYVVLDEERFCIEDLKKVLTNIGKFGYGRDASVGLGKFAIIDESIQAVQLSQKNANCYLTLANCSPVNNELDSQRSFYQVETRFGRHGDMDALSGQPFKKPIILAKIGAIFTPFNFEEKLFIGNGLTGISYSNDKAVHQGYAPIIALHIDFKDGE